MSEIIDIAECLPCSQWDGFVDWWYRMGYDDNYDIYQNNKTTRKYFSDWLLKYEEVWHGRK